MTINASFYAAKRTAERKHLAMVVMHIQVTNGYIRSYVKNKVNTEPEWNQFKVDIL